jgi:uncharacterized protein GlcG (DUF336 family)
MTAARTVLRASVAHELAVELVEAAQREAVAMGHAITVAVVDESGVLKAFGRMDGAPLLTVQIAQDKAYTAAGFGLATGDWRDMLLADEGLAHAAPAAIARLVAIGGGAPITLDGVVVGGLGISGGTPDQDAEVAGAALAVLNAAENVNNNQQTEETVR